MAATYNTAYKRCHDVPLDQILFRYGLSDGTASRLLPLARVGHDVSVHLGVDQKTAVILVTIPLEALEVCTLGELVVGLAR